MQSSLLELGDLFSDEQDRNEAYPIISGLDKVARKSVSSLFQENTVILFSGGIDSSILASLASQTEIGITHALFSLGAEGSSDIRNLRGGHSISGLVSPILSEVNEESIRDAAFHVSDLVQAGSLSHFEDCVAFYLIAGKLRERADAFLLVSANGPDELFCGYDRFRRILNQDGYKMAEAEILKSLQIANELRRQARVIFDSFGLKSREPFLEEEFVKFSLNVPTYLKIVKDNDLLRKRIWRAYGRKLGLQDQIVLKRKKAMQYSMGIHKIILPMAKNGMISLDANIRRN